MKKYEIKLINKNLAKEIIVKNHYSHKWSSCRYAIGLFYEENLLGVAIYGFPVGRQVVKSISPILENSNVLELTRLWINDSEGRNTESWFLGKTFEWLRKNDKNIITLISYSDPMYGHVGIIYQATNWIYQGNNTMLVKGFLHYINGEYLHPRSCVAKYGTIKENKLIEIDSNYNRKELLKKHRYIYILNKKYKNKILNSLKHPVLPYPKNNDNSRWN